MTNSLEYGKIKKKDRIYYANANSKTRGISMAVKTERDEYAYGSPFRLLDGDRATIVQNGKIVGSVLGRDDTTNAVLTKKLIKKLKKKLFSKKAECEVCFFRMWHDVHVNDRIKFKNNCQVWFDLQVNCKLSIIDEEEWYYMFFLDNNNYFKFNLLTGRDFLKGEIKKALAEIGGTVYKESYAANPIRICLSDKVKDERDLGDKERSLLFTLEKQLNHQLETYGLSSYLYLTACD